jgi:hypothetical protein
MLRNSEIQSWKTCRFRWNWTYVEGRQSAVAPTALRFGDLVHQALAVYYKPGTKRGPHPAKTFAKLYDAQVSEKREMGFDVFSDEEWVNALDLGQGMLEGYVARYAADDRAYRVLSSEQTFQLRLRHPDGFTFWIVGTFDGVWEHIKKGRIIFKEFKTARAIAEDGLPMDEQASAYWTYGPKWLRQKGILKDGQMPSEILYTFLRKAIPNPDKKTDAEGHVLNLDGSISKNQPAPYFARVPIYRDEADRRNLHERVLAEAAEIRAARAGLMVAYKNPGPLHMPNCRGCAVREACEVHETGGDWKPVLDFATVAWDPYAAHELAERH